MLSYRGSEQQRPSVPQLALRFEDSVAARKADPAFPALDNDEKVLLQLVSEYNSHKSVAGIEKWQLGDSTVHAMRALMLSTTPAVRELLRDHLHHHKWENSAFTRELLRSKRFLLNNKPTTGIDVWDSLLTVGPVAQLLVIKRMLREFEKKIRKAKCSWNSVMCLTPKHAHLVCIAHAPHRSDPRLGQSVAGHWTTSSAWLI